MNVLVDPSSVNDRESIKRGDTRLRKQRSEQVSDESSDSVGGEHIEGLVDPEEELDPRRKVTRDRPNKRHRDRRGCLDESSCGGDDDETDDRSGAEPDGGPLSLETPVEDEPGQSSDRGGEVGDDAGGDGSEVGGEGGSSVEPEPSEPEEDCAEDDVGRVVRLERESLGSVAASLAEVAGDGERGSSRRDVDGSSWEGREQEE